MEGSLLALISQKLDDLSIEARELYLESRVPRLKKPPNPLEFYRKYVSPNKPVIIEGGITHWPGVRKWSPDYFRNKIGDQTVTVAVTPNGYADAVNGGKFVMPEERRMKMCQFLDILDKSDRHNPGVFYIQKQNSNLTEEFSSIIEDVETDIPWGSEAFGKLPDAVNFWMGDGRAITSTHRDHYENLYCVVKGWKKFILIPPSDLPHVPYETYQAAVYKQDDIGEFQIIDDEATGQVPWVAVDLLNPDLEKYPQYAKCQTVEVTVREGDVLYLPSLWFHHVQQSHGCIAVNFWYDMEFDIKYNYYKFMENIVSLAR
ncbi:hypothetical protein CHS0354_011178 [Potamilus streckersoni]|uniref:Bifunctional peptidase and (3S)-lysyl hydroxylase JMJD7 n=1 Tax=Potamilus streckersoni TaxID=2493646 RepID=A0AAE0VME8_9BIVA|nr:hypothetical protein CHS0354_011178 [Potamilus streckersoni]